MKARVDAERCQGHGMCSFHGPEVFELDDLGYSKAGMRDVPPGLEDQARRGAQGCPERAIEILESTGGGAEEGERS